MSALTIGEEIAVDDVSFGGDGAHACPTAPSKVPSRYDVRIEHVGEKGS